MRNGTIHNVSLMLDFLFEKTSICSISMGATTSTVCISGCNQPMLSVNTTEVLFRTYNMKH